MMQIIGIVLVCTILGFGFYQIAFAGGSKEKGRDSLTAGGGAMPLW